MGKRRTRRRPSLPLAPGPSDGAGVAVSELVESGAEALKLDLAAGRAGLELGSTSRAFSDPGWR